MDTDSVSSAPDGAPTREGRLSMGLLLRAARLLLERRGVRVVLASAVAVAVAGVIVTLAPSSEDTRADGDCDVSPSDGDELPERTILGRVWFDRYPKKPTTEVNIAIWLAGGLGIYESGSAYRSNVEFFEFERRGNRLDTTLLQDKKKSETGFKVEKCDEEPFNVCLTIDDPARGPKKYFGFT
jgi:hypothetical protein